MNIQANLYKTGGRYYFQPRISSTAGLANSTANLFNPKIRHSGECRNPDFTGNHLVLKSAWRKPQLREAAAIQDRTTLDLGGGIQPAALFKE
jgi:hypothetical protein